VLRTSTAAYDEAVRQYERAIEMQQTDADRRARISRRSKYGHYQCG
jgi:hypothetical protein